MARTFVPAPPPPPPDGGMPLPLATKLCGLPAPLLTIEIDDVRAPVVLGLKTTPKKQLPPAGTVTPEQLLLTSRNSARFELVTLEIVTGLPPTFDSVTTDEPDC